MAMIKGLALLFCFDLSEIRLERDEGEALIKVGGKRQIEVVGTKEIERNDVRMSYRASW